MRGRVCPFLRKGGFPVFNSPRPPPPSSDSSRFWRNPPHAVRLSCRLWPKFAKFFWWGLRWLVRVPRPDFMPPREAVGPVPTPSGFTSFFHFPQVPKDAPLQIRSSPPEFLFRSGPSGTRTISFSSSKKSGEGPCSSFQRFQSGFLFIYSHGDTPFR